MLKPRPFWQNNTLFYAFISFKIFQIYALENNDLIFPYFTFKIFNSGENLRLFLKHHKIRRKIWHTIWGIEYKNYNFILQKYTKL